ncbi:sulfatase-like hydrolase/transferase [bacterium]|nr:sulfatase-like hydrolase/transferase [bacterium]
MANAKTEKPNVLVILVDDLGYGDLSSYGSSYIQTPHIDRLVNQGMKFTHGYANCPVCSPTRAALLTGRYQELVGVPGVIRTHKNNSWGYLDPECIMLPERMKKAGYHTACVGKWHLGLEEPNVPNTRGFDFFHGFRGDMMDDYWTHRRHGNNYMYKNDEQIDPEGHATELFTDWARDYIKSDKEGKPFFLYLAYNAPHTPIHPPEDWVERFRQREPQVDPKTAELAALIEHMDHGIGQVMQTLEDTGQAENTLVIFASDNGGQLRVNASNGALRAGKGDVYEGGIRVPMCAYWPGRIEAGTQTDRIALSMDIFPTVLEAAGLEAEHAIEGVSFYRTLMGKKQREPERDLIWSRKEGGRYNGFSIYAIRRGDWKLLKNDHDAPFELYNLKDDPLEKNNLIHVETQKARELRNALQAHLAECTKLPWRKR